MKFNFWTLGGGHFWEDVFFYQKWRIQRHSSAKTYRLLDNWDVRRYEGTFNECYQAFVKNIEIYELSRQTGHMIIMIPGLFESKNIFKPLWREAINKGYLVAAINYPSTLKSSDSHAKQVDFLLNHLEDVEKISFITKGSGVLVLDKLMQSKSLWRNKLKLNKIIAINPPHKLNPIQKLIASFSFIKWLLGPMLQELNKYKPSNYPKEIMTIKNFNKNSTSEIIKKL